MLATAVVKHLDVVEQIGDRRSIRVIGTDPRPAREAVWAGVTFQPSDAFQ